MIGADGRSDYPACTGQRGPDGSKQRKPAGGDVSGTTSGGPAGLADIVALSVHGPAGVLDLVVPTGASVADVAREYAQQSGTDHVLPLYGRLGTELAPEATLTEVRVTSGAVLVAMQRESSTPGDRRRRPEAARHRHLEPGSFSVLWFCVAVAAALLSGWFAALLPSSDLRTATIALLVGGAVLGTLPIGTLTPHRVLAAPAFAGAAAFAITWSSTPERLPTILGVSALTAAVAAAVARSLDQSSEEALRVWMLVGSLCFLVTGAGALTGVGQQVVWAILLAVAMLAARFVPGFAVEVPDQYLIDLERLAVTAWSARDRPKGRRGRIVVPRQAVAAVAVSGTRMVTAAAAAIFVVSAVSAPLLLLSADLPLDRIGARCLVGFTGAALLLAARSFRHTGARALLRAAGLVCWLSLATVAFGLMGVGGLGLAAGAAIGLAGLLIVVAVALGRGWRSAWWARRAEVAEGICGAFALASVVVAVGLFRHLWELTS